MTYRRNWIAASMFLFCLSGKAADAPQGGHTPASDSINSQEDSPGMEHSMSGYYGSYSMSREASGTSWQPEDTPMEGLHYMIRDWMIMVHGFANMVYDNQGGKRGDSDFFSSNMLMLMASRHEGKGTFGVRLMLSLEPATIGPHGYPELLQTGETGNGKTPLIDRQHPHDLFMEMAASYSYAFQADLSGFVYFGIPGEPALGPATFMHRFSGVDDPEAPITHHWLDSTHVTFGVATAGLIYREFKLDASLFTGREPNQYRWDIERPRFDSESVRLSYNPSGPWAFQVSYGHLTSPEQLDSNVDVDRITASVSYHHSWDRIEWQTTFAWGKNINHPGHNLDGFLLESAFVYDSTHTLFGRAERVEKDELFPAGDVNAGKSFTVNKLSLGYIYDLPAWNHLRFGIGALGTAHILPEDLKPSYGGNPLSCQLFVRVKL